MKTVRTLAAAMIASFAMPAMAEMKIGVVDLRQALFTSNAAQSFSEQLKSEFTRDENEVRAAQEAARKLQERLEKDGAMMNEAERTRLASEFEDKVKEFNYLKNRLDTAVAKRKQTFLQDSRPLVDESLKNILESRKLDLILPREAVVYVSPEMDLTPALIESLNKKR